VTTILVTAAGAPGAARLLRALRENGEREVRLVGVDMSERSIGRHLCDAFHLVPPGAEPEYADALLELVERERVDVVLPESSHDLPHLAARRDEFPVPVLVSGRPTGDEPMLANGSCAIEVDLASGSRRGSCGPVGLVVVSARITVSASSPLAPCTVMSCTVLAGS